jgi:hypothetical protein
MRGRKRSGSIVKIILDLWVAGDGNLKFRMRASGKAENGKEIQR